MRHALVLMAPEGSSVHVFRTRAQAMNAFRGWYRGAYQFLCEVRAIGNDHLAHPTTASFEEMQRFYCGNDPDRRVLIHPVSPWRDPLGE
jgi:hypothetical protein